MNNRYSFRVLQRDLMIEDPKQPLDAHAHHAHIDSLQWFLFGSHHFESRLVALDDNDTDAGQKLLPGPPIQSEETPTLVLCHAPVNGSRWQLRSGHR